MILVSEYKQDFRLTVGRVHVGDVGVVRQPARQQGDAGRAADGRGAVVALVQRALVDEMLPD